MEKEQLEKLLQLIKSNQIAENAIYLSEYAGCIYVALLGYKGTPMGVAEFMLHNHKGEFAFYDFHPIEDTANVGLINSLDRIAKLIK